MRFHSSHPKKAVGSAVTGKRGGILAASQEKTNYAGRGSLPLLTRRQQVAVISQNTPESIRENRPESDPESLFPLGPSFDTDVRLRLGCISPPRKATLLPIPVPPSPIG